MNGQLTYSRLAKIHEANNPYRGTEEYAYSYREHRQKYFIPKEVNGKFEYHIGYWWEWEREFMTPDEFHARKNSMGKRELNKWESTTDENDKPCFRKYFKSPRILGIVRDDESFEFTTDDYLHQGDRYILSGGGGYFQQSVRHGGCIYIDRNGYGYHDRSNFFIMPIFKGLRVNMETMKPHKDSEYKIIKKKINRKLAKQALSIYQTGLNLCETMFKVMSNDSFVSDYLSVIEENNTVSDPDRKWWTDDERQALKQKARAVFIDEPISAVYMFMKSYRVAGIDWVTEGRDMSRPPLYLFHAVKHKLIKEVYVMEDTFDKVMHGVGDKLPSSIWELDVVVNDTIVKRL